MIVIKRNTTNRIVLTLTEKSVSEEPEYLFRFTNDTTKGVQEITLDDQSTAKGRFNLFFLTEGEDVSFDTDGFYSYEVFDGDVSVETGKMLVGELKNSVESYDPEPAETTKTYNPQ
jgi:hypothetical protein